jgi:glycosyltransferase involved in cell wall biosynthesis
MKKIYISSLTFLICCISLADGDNTTSKIDLSVYDVLWNKFKDVQAKDEKHFVVLIPSYNNSKWYKKNLDSIFMQKYSNFHIVYIDDCSPDGTGDLVEKYVKEKHQEHRVTLIKNKERRKAMANVYTGVLMCDDNDIIATCDGDDWWANDHVLALLNKIYQDPDVWITHGNLMHWPRNRVIKRAPFPANIIRKNKFREYRWCASGLRSFYAWLFKKIKIEDLCYNGKFVSSSHDLAIMYPMFEMAGYRIKFIPDVLYVANRATGINDFKICKDEQEEIANFLIHQKTKYKPLKIGLPRK